MKRSKEALGTWIAVGCMVVAAAMVRWVQPGLARSFASIKTTEDLYAIPAPSKIVVASLGYRSALADLVFAHVRVAYGTSFAEKRRFTYIGDYLEALMELDPKFRAPYHYIDTFLTLQPVPPPKENYRRARDLYERALTHVTDDAHLWLIAGQFTAYLAPPHLPENEDFAEWRLAGARMLARACDLLGGNKSLPYHCSTAATLFSDAGEREATIRSLRQVIAAADDEEVKRRAMAYLRRVVDEQEAIQIVERTALLDRKTRTDQPLASPTQIQILGPNFDPVACLAAQRPTPSCATSWRQHDELLPRASRDRSALAEHE